MKLNKIFIVSLLLLAIIAIGAASASEDIVDDSIAAIEPTDEVITDSVEEEPTDDALSQVFEEEITDNTELGNAKEIQDDFEITIYENPGPYDDILKVKSTGYRNGTLNFYLNNAKKVSYTFSNGSYNYGSSTVYMDEEGLGIRKSGIYAIKVTFEDNDENLGEVILNETTYTTVICQIPEESNIMSIDEVFSLILEFPGITSGTVKFTDTISEKTGGFIINKTLGSVNIQNERAVFEISGLDPNYNHYLLVEYSTNYGNGIRSCNMKIINNAENVKVSIPTEIEAGTDALITVSGNDGMIVYLIVDGKEIVYYNMKEVQHIIPDLTVGTHYVKVIFHNDMYTSNSATYSNSFKITVKEPAPAKVTKLATKIVAAKKTFKVKTKTKKYTITLKTKAGKAVKKVKVTLKVKGKTYKATTNTKGKATFKIKNLKKKGKYTATIKFAGNKNYKASTKKVKITVKK